MRASTVVAAALLAALALPASAEGDAEAGEKVYRKCKSCHMVGEDAKNRVGPALNGVIGASVAANEEFKYSDALLEKKGAGETWTPEALDAYLADPKGWAPGTKMTFAGLKDAADRADLIAYLATFQ